jgi:hypothetical protein
MAREAGCADVEDRLTQSLLARSEPDARDRAHAQDCAVCGPLLRELTSLRGLLEGSEVEVDAPESVVRATLARARSLLEGSRQRAPLPARVPGGLPEGFSAECLRLLGAALVPFPLVVAWNLAFLALGEQLLGGLVPAALLTTVGVAYVAAAAGWSALLYGSIPILAHRRVQRRTAEVSS